MCKEMGCDVCIWTCAWLANEKFFLMSLSTEKKKRGLLLTSILKEKSDAKLLKEEGPWQSNPLGSKNLVGDIIIDPR